MLRQDLITQKGKDVKSFSYCAEIRRSVICANIAHESIQGASNFSSPLHNE